jgi:hypothetical protein
VTAATVDRLPEALRSLPRDVAEDLMCRADAGIWAERRRGMTNAPLHWEWYDLLLRETRCAVCAPREHAKTEVFTVNGTAHRSIYAPGTWTYVFANTADQAEKIKDRIDSAIEESHPHLVEYAKVMSMKTSVYANGSMVTVAGAGKAVRGAHPDWIVGDDVMEESSALTALQRRKLERWWLGTVGGMAHPGTTRVLPKWNKRDKRSRDDRAVRMPPTRVFLVGTPFHSQDLLLNMRLNPLYRYYRYAAEYGPGDLVVPGSLAVEVA